MKGRKILFSLYLKIFIIWIYFFHGAGAQCLFRSQTSGLCHDCSSEYSRDSGNPDAIDPSVCKKRRKIEPTSLIEVFVKNEVCSEGEPCDGTELFPFDSIEKALQEAHSQSNKLIESEVKLHLLGETHFVLKNSKWETTRRIFFGVNASVEIAPWVCEKKILKGCFQTEERAKVRIKSEDFSFFASGNFTIKNVEFTAIDLLYNENKGDCLNERRVCCDIDNYIEFTSNCSISEESPSFNLINDWGDLRGMFNLKPIISSESSTYIVPTLIVENCSFTNFHSVYNKRSGWVSLFSFAIDGGANVLISKTSFKNLRFMRGIIWATDFSIFFPSFANDELADFLKSQAKTPAISIVDCFFESYDAFNIFGYPELPEQARRYEYLY